MVIKVLVLALFISACGREVNLKTNKLESTQQITQAEAVSLQKPGLFIKNSNAIVINGASYTISVYSSKNALDFVASIPAGSQVPVYIIGGFSSREVVIESIVRQ